MKRVPTVQPYTRRTLRALAIVQGLLILVSLMVPITAMAAITAVTPGTQAPDPVTAGSNTTYTVQVTNGAGATSRGISITSISGLPAGASLFSSSCANVPGGASADLTVIVATTGATAGGTYPIVMTATRWTPATGACSGGVNDTLTGNASLVVTGAALIGTTTTITSDLPDPSTVNTAYSVDVSVSRASGSTAITGTVTVSDGTDSCTDPTPTGGAAATVTYSCSLTSTTTGSKTLTASFPANATFSASSGSAAHTVLAAQTITFPALSGVRLDQAAPTTAATASSGLAVTYSTGSTACSVTSVGVITLLHAGTCTIDADQAGNATYAAAPQVSQAFAIAKGDQTISFDSLTDQGLLDSPVAIAATATSGLTVTFASDSPAVCTVSGTSVTLLTDGTCSITSSQAGDADWNAASPTVTQTFQVTLATSTTVVTCPAGVVYDGSVQEPCTVSVTGAGGLSLTPTPIYTLNTDVGTATASYTFAGDANHSGSTDSTTFDITAAASTTVVTFEPGSRAFRGSPFTATAVVDGPGGLHQPVSVVMSGNCVDVTVPNGCTATATFPGNGNHYGSSDTQSITITPASQVISFATVDNTTTDASEVQLVASADSSLAVTFTSLTPAVCTVSGSIATILTAGTCMIEAEQAGDVNHDAAAPVTQSFVITAGTDSGNGPDSGTGAGTDGAPAPPDTSLSGTNPLTSIATGSIPLVVLIGALTAAALAVIVALMTLTVVKRQRDEDEGNRA